MTSPTTKRQRTLTALALLQARFPALFPAKPSDVRPLALGIHQALVGRLASESGADPIGNRILDALRAAGGTMSQTALHAAFGRNLPAERLSAALTVLQEHGRITSETRKTSGRPCVVWKLLLNEERRIKPPDSARPDTSFFFLRKDEHREPPIAPGSVWDSDSGRWVSKEEARP